MPKGREGEYVTKKQLKKVQDLADYNLKRGFQLKNLIDKLDKKIQTKKFRR